MKNCAEKALSLALAFVLFASASPLRLYTSAAAKPVPGDVDLSGDVTSEDARLALRRAVGLERLSAEKTVNADADRDGKITASDARLILRKAVGLETLASPKAADMKSAVIRGADRDPYQSDDFELLYLTNITVGGSEHTILDNYFTVTIPTKPGTKEEDLLNMVGLIYGESNKPFMVLPDATARVNGEFKIETLHFSPVGAGKLTNAQLLDLWATRAAAQGVTRRISEEEITPGLADMIADGLQVAGLGQDQYAGAIVRSILSLDTRGEIVAAAANGDMNELRAKVANFAGEYYLGKLFKGEEDKLLTKSLGDNAEAIRKSVKDGDYATATLEIVKNIEKNMFPAVNYADKIASLTDKLADIWTDDMMNEQYEKYKEMSVGGKVSDDDWTGIYMVLRGASHRLSAKGVSAADLRKKFEQRVKNEAKIEAERKALLRDAAGWRSLGLLDSTYWHKSDGTYFSDTERLNSLRQSRETVRALLTLNGKFQRGKGYQTDGDFLKDALFEWITNGPKGRSNFYKWLRQKGVYLPKTQNTDDDEEPYTGMNPFHPGQVIEGDLPEVDDDDLGGGHAVKPAVH